MLEYENPIRCSIKELLSNNRGSYVIPTHTHLLLPQITHASCISKRFSVCNSSEEHVCVEGVILIIFPTRSD